MGRSRFALASLLWLALLGAGAASCELIAGLHDRELECDACVDATPEVGPVCTPPKSICEVGDAGDASMCLDLSSDPNHCGGCTKTCAIPDAGAFDATSGNPDPGIASFDAGAEAAYISLPSPSCEAGACGLECTGRTLCSGLCFDTNDLHDHCGSCATACPSTQWCHGGHCCDAGTENCDGGCIDVVGNANNCGGCGIVCPSTTPNCFGGACVKAVPVTTVCGLSNPMGDFCSGNCSFNHAQYADAYCKLAGFTSAVSYTVITSGSVPCIYYTTGNTVPTVCSQLLTTSGYGTNATCDAISNLLCQ